MRFNTFDQVAKWYNDTKPLVSKHHSLSDDIRPIGDRKRKWERIKKVDDNTYALIDGNYGRTMYRGSSATDDEHLYEADMGPIVWTREADGDYIKIRNHRVGCTSVTRYNFLLYKLPDALRFKYNQQGKHWLVAKVEGGSFEEFVLPKNKVEFDYRAGVVTHVDETFLKFRVNSDGTFTRVSKPLKVMVKRVDATEKKKWKAHINALYQHMATIAPMIGTTWDARNEYSTQIRDWASENGHPNVRWVSNTASIPVDVVRDIVSTEDHPLRIALYGMILYDIDGSGPLQDEDDLRRIRASFTRVMNKAMGLYKTEEM